MYIVHWSKYSPKFVFLKCFNFVQICEFADKRKFKVRKKAWVRKSQIHKLQTGKSQKRKRLGPQIANAQSPTFAEVRKSNKLFQSANLRICVFAELTVFADHPPFESLTRFNV